MRIEVLTFLRFFAALVVVVFHYGRGSALANWAHPLMISGSQMVTFFFVLSGFVLTISQHGRHGHGIRRFYLARLARIAPIYWVALVAALVLLPASDRSGPGDLFLHATFIHAWFPGHVYQLNFPAWSVSVEAFFYLCFPFVLAALRRHPARVRSLLCLTLAFWLLTQLLLIWVMNFEPIQADQRVLFAMINFLPINHLCSFLLGVTAGYAFVKRPSKLQDQSLLGLLSCVAALAAIFCALKYSPALAKTIGCKLPVKVSFLAPLFMLLVWSLARCENILTRGLSARPLALLGESSYSLYIPQTPVLIAYRKHLLPHLSLEQEPAFYVYLGLLIVVSLGTLFAIERPGRRLLLRMTSAARGRAAA